MSEPRFLCRPQGTGSFFCCEGMSEVASAVKSKDGKCRQICCDDPAFAGWRQSAISSCWFVAVAHLQREKVNRPAP